MTAKNSINVGRDLGVSQVDNDRPRKVTEQNGRVHCMNGELVRILVKKLESRGLDSRLVIYPGDADDDEHVEEIVITNPAARERGEIRVGDDGSVTWEYFGRLDETGVSNLVDEVTNALRATGVRLVRDSPVMKPVRADPMAGSFGLPGPGRGGARRHYQANRPEGYAT
jgi:hypothetical protein